MFWVRSLSCLVRERYLLSHCFLIFCLALFFISYILEKLEDVDLILVSATDSVPNLRHIYYVICCPASPSAKCGHLWSFPCPSSKATKDSETENILYTGIQSTSYKYTIFSIAMLHCHKGSNKKWEKQRAMGATCACTGQTRTLTWAVGGGSYYSAFSSF